MPLANSLTYFGIKFPLFPLRISHKGKNKGKYISFHYLRGWKACKIRKVQEISPQIPIVLIIFSSTFLPLGQFRLRFHPFCKLIFFPVNCGIHLAYKSQSGCDYFPTHIFLKLTTKNRVSASPVIPHEKIYKRYSDEIVWKCANTV